VSVGLTKEVIFDILQKLMKNVEIPIKVKEDIELYSS